MLIDARFVVSRCVEALQMCTTARSSHHSLVHVKSLQLLVTAMALYWSASAASRTAATCTCLTFATITLPNDQLGKSSYRAASISNHSALLNASSGESCIMDEIYSRVDSVNS